MSQNEQVVVASTPHGKVKIFHVIQTLAPHVVHAYVGVPKESDFKLESIPTPQESDLKKGQIIVKTKFISPDPYLRGVLNDFPVGKPLISGSVGEIIATKHSAFLTGKYVQGYWSWSRYAIIDGPKEEKKEGPPKAGINDLVSTPPRILDESVPIQTSLGVLGMPGMTAYFGLFDVASLKDGDVVFVSGAAGAVGSLVGQFAKLHGHCVIGSAGGAEKCKHVVDDLGFDACIDYKQFKTQAEVKAELERLSPKGIDVYFDNTGGHVTDAVFDVLNKFGRVAVCGQIAMYNETNEQLMAPLILHKLIYKSIRVQGFLVGDFKDRADEFFKYTTPLVIKGQLKYRETIFKGFDTLPKAFIGLFHGANVGKAIVQVE